MMQRKTVPPVRPALRPGISILVLVALAFSVIAYSPRTSVLAEQDGKQIELILRDGKALIKKGKYDKAAEMYKEALKVDPRDVRALLGLAFASVKVVDYVQCFEVANEALKN